MEKMEKPQISVIIPVYNVEKYLPACLDSLLAQTYQNFELICVNDGSRDGSRTILEQHAHRDSRVRVFCKENGGVSRARNIWEKGRVATMLYCPHLGGAVWKYARRLQSRPKRQ